MIKKQKEERNFLIERIENLQNFLNYLVKNEDIFCCEVFKMFFDPKEKESEIGEKLINYFKFSTDIILERYKQIFPKFSEKSTNISDYKTISDFERKLDLNQRFYKNLSNLIFRILKNKNTTKIKNLEKFYNNIIIPISEQNDLFQELNRNVESVGESNIFEYLQNFKEKIEKLLFEIEAYKEIVDNFNSYQNIFLLKIKEKNLLNQNIKEITLSEKNLENSLFLKKEEVLALEHDLEISENLIEIFFQLLTEREIPNIEQRQNLFFFKNLNILSKQISLLIKEKLIFWGKIKDITEKIVN